ncbi:MAG: glucuronate isomerase [Lachnospiraceae bacterium]|nr:glucuronate isomerase [Lachnospiraceae bacterium]
MKAFMDQDFLLSTDTARALFHDYAERLPVIDYHCHINPREILEDRRFRNITEVWLGGDHYKWRAMRSNGVDEYYITGDAPDREKFQKYAETLEKCIGNPLYHWSHLELQRFFDYHGVLSGRTAEEVWNLANEKLQTAAFSARNLVRKANVTVICTTDDPVDSLEYHAALKQEMGLGFSVYPAWRPDRAMNIRKPDFTDYVKQLSEVAGMEIRSFGDLTDALMKRMAFFDSMGCRVSDHGLDYVPYSPADPAVIEEIFAKRMNGENVTAAEEAQYQTAFLLAMGKGYSRYNWIMQLHYGCKRNNNTRMFRAIGADTGFDCIRNDAPGSELADFLDALNVDGCLPKTILYSLNPVDNAMIGTIIGCFQDGSAAGKIQQGSAWWFNDHKPGMTEQMRSLASLGVLGNFIGMLTDSRSFLSYPRHEYFRRIMCDFVGTLVENGEYPDDRKALKAIVEGISYYNAKAYFGFRPQV